jgi:hypothetical protein
LHSGGSRWIDPQVVAALQTLRAERIDRFSQQRELDARDRPPARRAEGETTGHDVQSWKALECGEGTAERFVTSPRASLRRSADRERCDESVSAARQSLDETRRPCAVVESAPKLLESGVEPSLEVYVRPIGPETSLRFLPRNDLSRPLDQQLEQLEGQSLERDPAAAAAQLAGVDPQLEDIEAQASARAAQHA